METAQRISTTLKPYVNTVCRIANGVLDALASPATAQGLTQGFMQSMPRSYPALQQQQQMYRAPTPPPAPPMRGTLVGGKKRRGKKFRTQKRH